eukprot:gnl/TRDRNA2_/TRDRNA2_58336_c0_seq1.p1 gnl/TRDRNA2_/TRDRNA2_58336_c0~~gnl/TRDRNA2_/TRDRNA2_58336_c0_seq1.p1  ORF type:complete len:193 (-),score=61.46 gnl/TRDRNA2_/TRDRNA2_58336_c0_seq1:520-1098(-)
MADYIRRSIEPLLRGLDQNTLEIIVGILEISGETGELAPDDHADIVELLMSAHHCGDPGSAAMLCEKLTIAAVLRMPAGLSTSEAFGENIASTTSEYQHDALESGQSGSDEKDKEESRAEFQAAQAKAEEKAKAEAAQAKAEKRAKKKAKAGAEESAKAEEKAKEEAAQARAEKKAKKKCEGRGEGDRGGPG